MRTVRRRHAPITNRWCCRVKSDDSTNINQVAVHPADILCILKGVSDVAGGSSSIVPCRFQNKLFRFATLVSSTRCHRCSSTKSMDCSIVQPSSLQRGTTSTLGIMFPTRVIIPAQPIAKACSRGRLSAVAPSRVISDKDSVCDLSKAFLRSTCRSPV